MKPNLHVIYALTEAPFNLKITLESLKNLTITLEFSDHSLKHPNERHINELNDGKKLMGKMRSQGNEYDNNVF